MRRFLVFWSILLTAGVLLCGCSELSQSRTTPEYSIGVVFKAMNSPYWLDMQTGMEEAANELGIDLTLLYPENDEAIEEQEQIVSDLLDSDIDLLMVSPCDSFNTAWMKDEADKKGIAMMNVDDRGIDISVPYIGSDHIKIGQDVAYYFRKTLPEGGNIFLILGPDCQMSSQDRLKGIQYSLDDKFRISGIKHTSMTQNSAYQAIMEADEKIDGVFCHNIVLAQGAAVALEERGWDAKIITVDIRTNGMQMIKRGTIDAVLVQDGFSIGYRAIQRAVSLLKTEKQIQNELFFSELLTVDSEEDAK